MAARILDGKAVAAKVRGQAAARAAALRRQGVEPCLAVILVGDDSASRIYVRNKEKDCREAGIRSEEITLPATAPQAQLLAHIDTLNRRADVDGILVQLPLPGGIDERAVIAAIDPRKDVDAFHPVNVGRIMIGDPELLPCTPAGVMALLDDAGIGIDGKNCVVIGRSNIVGKPMAMLLLHRHGTVTVCHSHTRGLGEITRRADILVAAVGRARFVTADMVKDGAVVVDVGMNRLPDGKLAGDVDFAAVAQKAAWITPVPGGVGPMTRAMLLQNTLRAAARRAEKD